MKIVSVLESPEYTEAAIDYIYSKWGSERTYNVYRDSISHCAMPFQNWYLLVEDDKPIGCAGLIANDFISRMDLYPWLCALYIDPEHRGKAYGRLLMERIKADAAASGSSNLYLATDHIGYYEKYGFSYIGDGYHPWGDSSRIYEAKLV